MRNQADLMRAFFGRRNQIRAKMELTFEDSVHAGLVQHWKQWPYRKGFFDDESKIVARFCETPIKPSWRLTQTPYNARKPGTDDHSNCSRYSAFDVGCSMFI